MSILGLKPVADQLGITTSRLRYFLDRESVVPYRKCDLGGDKHIRYFTGKDAQTIQNWWTQKETEDDGSL